MNNEAMKKLSCGLFVLSAKENGKDNGCIINTVIQVTNKPERVAFAVNKSNYTHDMLMKNGDFTVSVISESADFSLFKRFGFVSGRNKKRYTCRDRGYLCVYFGKSLSEYRPRHTYAVYRRRYRF